jgi:hypothetical protein
MRVLEHQLVRVFIDCTLHRCLFRVAVVFGMEMLCVYVPGSVDIMTPSPVRFMKPAPTPGNPNPDVTARASSRNEVLQQQQQPLLPSSGLVYLAGSCMSLG